MMEDTKSFGDRLAHLTPQDLIREITQTLQVELRHRGECLSAVTLEDLNQLEDRIRMQLEEIGLQSANIAKTRRTIRSKNHYYLNALHLPKLIYQTLTYRRQSTKGEPS